MTFARGAVLWLLVACSSSHPPAQAPQIADAPHVAPVQPLAIAIVVEGWEMWIGNDQVRDIPEAERYPGAWKALQDGFARLPLAGFPEGSKATIVTYTDRAVVRAAMAPIDHLTAATLGDQRDYVGGIDRDLVGGVTVGLDELAKVTGARRVLVVIGDGSDTNQGTAKQALATLGQRAAAEHVEVVSIVYKAELSPLSTAIAALDPSPLAVTNADAIADQLAWLFARLTQRPGATGSHAVALAVLVSGWEAWMGNDEIVPANDPSRTTGALAAIRAALDRAQKTGFPDGSKAMVATYDDRARIRLPMGPIASLDARAIGSQRDYDGGIGVELVSGVTLALTELTKVNAGRRVLVVVGDGSDSNNGAAQAQLRDLAKRAAEQHIEVHAIVYKTALSSEATVVGLLDPKATTVTSSDGLTTQLVALLERLRNP